VKVLEFFDFPGLRQGVEDLRELLHKGAQGDRKAEVFQVSNEDTAVAQRRLKDKKPEEKTNTNCLRSIQQCMKSGVAKHLGVAGIQQQSGLVDETNVTVYSPQTSASNSLRSVWMAVLDCLFTPDICIKVAGHTHNAIDEISPSSDLMNPPLSFLASNAK
nr:hypothetical protein [Tanacetum cinerariifolium]